MRAPSLILRWLLIVAVCVLGGHYVWSLTKNQQSSGYRIVPLMQGSKAVGLPLAGVAVDPNRKDIYAIVGGKNGQLPADFFVLWKRKDGAHYGLTLFEQDKGARAFCQMDGSGKLETLQNLWSANNPPPLTTNRNPEEEAALRMIVQALPPSFELSSTP